MGRMTKKLYRYMNWREMEGIIYSDTGEPENCLVRMPLAARR